jgi:hypothetical protein
MKYEISLVLSGEESKFTMMGKKQLSLARRSMDEK